MNTPPYHFCTPANRQRGAATLIVVMVLFFIISMVAAYTSRNLIFEQRTAANQYRSTQAFEAAEAGIEWALGQLNAGRMTNSCSASVDDAASADQSFRERYVSVSQTTGNVTPSTATGSGSVHPSCVFDASASSPADWVWSCSCPQPGASTPALSTPTAAGPAPAFVVRLIQDGAGLPDAATAGRADLMTLQSKACTRNNPACLDFDNDSGESGEGTALLNVVVSLRGALTRLPIAPLTVAGTMAALPTGSTLTLNNLSTQSGGFHLHTGGPLPGGAITNAVLTPGSPPSSTWIANDPSLTPADATATVDASSPTVLFSSNDRRFAAFFGMAPWTYEQQPGVVRLPCPTTCTAADITQAMTRNPGHAIWLTGGGSLTLNTNTGSDTAPALIITEGDVSIDSGIVFKGLLYGRKASWVIATSGIHGFDGAVVAEGALTLTGVSSTINMNYNQALLTAFRVSYGSFVRVPGSWKDFR